MAKLKPLAPQDLLTYNAFRLWVAGLPDDHVFCDAAAHLRSTRCPLAQFAAAVWPAAGQWLANGLSLVHYTADRLLVPDVRVEAPWTREVPQAFDRAFPGETDVTAARLRAALPWLAP